MSDPTTIALLEGVSDIAAVRAILQTHGIDGSRVELYDLGGVTNIGRVLPELRMVRHEADVIGMCDAKEAAVVVKALAADGLPVSDASDLPIYGFFVCEQDLEDELLRALTPERALGVIEGSGLAGKFEALRIQAAWADKPLAEQLHRFAGAASGRKEQVAALWAAALTREELPEPLAMLVERIQWA